MAQKNVKENKQPSPLANVWKNQLETLIDDFMEESGSSDSSENINFLLSSFFNNAERSELVYTPTETADIVYSATSTVTFMVKLGEYWKEYKKHCMPDAQEENA